MDVKDLEPSLTCDLNHSWSQPADLSSGNSSLSNSTVPDQVKKPKKKWSPPKPNVPQPPQPPPAAAAAPPPPPVSELHHFDHAAALGILPPFGAFAGFKMEPSPSGFPPNGAPPQFAPPSPQLNNNGGKVTVKKKKKTPQLSLDKAGSERKPVLGGGMLQEPLRDNSNLKLCNGLMDRNEMIGTLDGRMPVRSPSSFSNPLRSPGDSCTPPISPHFPPFSHPAAIGNSNMNLKQSDDVEKKMSNYIQNRVMPPQDFRGVLNTAVGDTPIKKQTLPSDRPFSFQHQGLNGFGGVRTTMSDGGAGSKLSTSPQFLSNNSQKPFGDLGSLKSPKHKDQHSTDLKSPVLPPSSLDMFGGFKAKPDTSYMLNGVMPSGHSPLSSPKQSAKGSPTKPPPSPRLDPNLTFASPEEELDNRLRANVVETPPKCGCLGPTCKFSYISLIAQEL
jgi:hypothetical protein